MSIQQDLPLETGLLLTIVSGLACCLGASVIFSDLVFQRFLCTRYIKIAQSSSFLVASLAFGSGIMLFSSFYQLLPEAKRYMDKSHIFGQYSGIFAILFYFLGVIGSVLLNLVIHSYIMKEEEEIKGDRCHHNHERSKKITPNNYLPKEDRHRHHPKMRADDTQPLLSTIDNMYHCDNEASPLLPRINGHASGHLNSSKPANFCKGYIKCDDDDDNGAGCTNERSVCIVESDNDEAVLEEYLFNQHHHSHGILSGSGHHHNLYNSSQRSGKETGEKKTQLMHIGIQTALAISIHKFPEGLITYISSKASPTLGFALFVAIALHNISEGFTIALPLYLATRSRMKSFLIASLLGGCSQPFGALIGWLFIRESIIQDWDINAVYGGLFAATSGLMGLIAVQGMLPQAIKSDRSDGLYVNAFFFLGVLIMGTSSAIMDILKPEP